MTDAASPFLNLPLRPEREAQAAREQQRRLEHHGAAFCRQVLDGAFERIDQPDGGYRLRAVATGHWVDDETSLAASATHEAPRPASAERRNIAQTALASPISVPATAVAACRLGYQTALRDIAHWISTAAVEPRMHAETLAALNTQISLLADRPARTIGHVELG